MAIVRQRLDPSNPPRFSAEQMRRQDALTTDEIERMAQGDPDNPPMTDEELSRAVFARSVRQARAGVGLTQQIFAERFHIALSRLRDWERGRYQPDSVAAAYIKAILHSPKVVEDALRAGE